MHRLLNKKIEINSMYLESFVIQGVILSDETLKYKKKLILSIKFEIPELPPYILNQFE